MLTSHAASFQACTGQDALHISVPVHSFRPSALRLAPGGAYAA